MMIILTTIIIIIPIIIISSSSILTASSGISAGIGVISAWDRRCGRPRDRTEPTNLRVLGFRI